VSRVAVILPTYNRASWLADAFDALAQQHFQNFRLIIVDDGSTDDTQQVAARLIADAPFPAEILHQQNAGAGPARQAGIDHAFNTNTPLDLFAFYDSDDRWTPNHLSDCVHQLDQHPDVDWVFTSVRIIDDATGRVMAPDVFNKPDVDRPILHPAAAETRGHLRVITADDRFDRLMAGDNLAGFQVSVIRRRLFDPARQGQSPRPLRIPPVAGEDRVLAPLAMAAGYRFAYLPAVHVDYRVHAGNNSGVDPALTWPKRRRTLRRHAFGLRYIRRHLDPVAQPHHHAVATAALAKHLFWHLGYHTLPHDHRRGLTIMARALSLDPHHPDRWKTYTAHRLRHALPFPAASPARRAA